jgi:hypothetical protein
MGIDIGIAVNLSMWNLEAQELPDQIAGLTKSVGMPAHRLELEITESAIMGDPQRTMRTLTLIRDLGVRFTIDDFGTGYSSLAHLRKLPVTGMKIDKSFVQNMESDRDNAVIVRSIIDLGHNLGLKVTAEGVETQAAKDMLVGFECDEAQGYYYSYPIPAHEIAQLFRKRTLAAASFSTIKHLDRKSRSCQAACKGHSLTWAKTWSKLVRSKIKMKGVESMKRNILRNTCAGLMVMSVLAVPGALPAQQSATQQVDGFSVLGSVLLSVLHVPLKFVTCVGTQTGAAVAYTATFGVAGNYDGGTNGSKLAKWLVDHVQGLDYYSGASEQRLPIAIFRSNLELIACADIEL